jgi:hypothetical protein
MGALYLQPLDERMERLGVFHARLMDDWVVLAPTRWKLRAAIRKVNEVMGGVQGQTTPSQDLHRQSLQWVRFFGLSLFPGGIGRCGQEHWALGRARNPAL